jgi:ribonuclease HI
VPAHQVGGDRLNDFADRAASHAAIVQEPAGSHLGSPPPPAPVAVRKAPRPSGSNGASRTGGSGAAGGGAARTLKAKYPGRCRCGRPYAAGELIGKNADGWGHPDCR